MANWGQYYQTGYSVSSNAYIQQPVVQYPLMSELRPEDFSRNYPADSQTQQQNPPFTITQYGSQGGQGYAGQQYGNQQYAQQYATSQGYAGQGYGTTNQGYQYTSAQDASRSNLVNVPNQRHINQADPRQNRAAHSQSGTRAPSYQDSYKTSQNDPRQSRWGQEQRTLKPPSHPPAQTQQRSQSASRSHHRSQPPPPGESPHRSQPPSHSQQRSMPPPQSQQRSQPPPQSQQRSHPPPQSQQRSQPPAQSQQRSQPPSQSQQSSQPSQQPQLSSQTQQRSQPTALPHESGQTRVQSQESNQQKSQPSSHGKGGQISLVQERMVKMAVGDDMEISDGEDEAAKEEWENCDVCGINFSSENAYRMHCTGMLHTQKIAARDANQSKPVVQHVVQKSQSTPRQSTPHIDLTKDDGEDFTKDVELDWTKGYFQKSGEQLNSSITQAPSSISNKKDYHCKMCDKRFLGEPGMWQNHIIGKNHCKLMLKLQLQLGFKAFEAKYGDVECGLNISNGPVETASEVMNYGDVPNEEREKYRQFVFRCGVMNDYQCTICNMNLNSVDRWVTHTQSKKHFKKFIFYLTKIKDTAEDFWQECGNLPGVYPGKIKDAIPTEGVPLKPWVRQAFGIQGGAPAPRPANEMPFEGTVTQLRNSFGVVNDSIFFDLHIAKSLNLQLRDRVKGLYVPSPNTSYKFKAVKIELASNAQNKVPPLMGTAAPGAAAKVGYPPRPSDSRLPPSGHPDPHARDPYGRPYTEDYYRRPAYPHDPYYDHYRRAYPDDPYYRHPDKRRALLPHPDDRRPPPPGHPDDRRLPPPDPNDPYRRPYADDPYYRPPYPDDRRVPPLLPDDRRPPPPDPNDPYRRPHPDDPYYRAPYPDDRRLPLPDPNDPYRRPYPDDPYYRAPYPDDRRPPLLPDDRRPPPHPDDPYRRQYPDDPYYRPPHPDDRRPPPHPDDPYRRPLDPYPDSAYRRHEGTPEDYARRPDERALPADFPPPEPPVQHDDPKIIDCAHNQKIEEYSTSYPRVSAVPKVDIPGIDMSEAEYTGLDFEGRPATGASVPKGVPPPDPLPGKAGIQPSSMSMFSVEELRKLQDTLKKMEAAKDDPFKQLALAAELRLLQDKQKEAKELTKSIPLTQAQALRKLSGVMSEEQMEQLKKEMVKIEKRNKGKDERRREERKPERSSSRSKPGKSNAQKQIEDSIMSEFQGSPSKDKEAEKRRDRDKKPPWRGGEKDQERRKGNDTAPWDASNKSRDVAPWEMEGSRKDVAPWEKDDATPWDSDNRARDEAPWEKDENRKDIAPWDADNDASWERDEKPKSAPWDTQEASDAPWDSDKVRDAPWESDKAKDDAPWEADASWESGTKDDGVSLVTSDNKIREARSKSTDAPWEDENEADGDPWSTKEDLPWDADAKDTSWDSPEKQDASIAQGRNAGGRENDWRSGSANSWGAGRKDDGVALITPDIEAKIREARKQGKAGGDRSKSNEVTLVTPDIEAKIRAAREQAKRGKPENGANREASKDAPWDTGESDNVTLVTSHIEAKVKEARKLGNEANESTGDTWRSEEDAKENTWRSSSKSNNDDVAPWDTGRKVEVVAPWDTDRKDDITNLWDEESKSKDVADVTAPWDSDKNDIAPNPWDADTREENVVAPWDTEKDKTSNPWDSNAKKKNGAASWDEEVRENVPNPWDSKGEDVLAPWEMEKKEKSPNPWDTDRKENAPNPWDSDAKEKDVVAPWEVERKGKTVAPWEEDKRIVVVAPWEKETGGRNKSPPPPPLQAPWERDAPKKPEVTSTPALGTAPPWANKPKEDSEELSVTKSDVQAAKRAPWNRGKDDSDEMGRSSRERSNSHDHRSQSTDRNLSRERDLRSNREDWNRSPGSIAPWDKKSNLMGDGMDRDYRSPRDMDLRRGGGDARAPWETKQDIGEKGGFGRGRGDKEAAIDTIKQFLVAHEDFHRKGGSHLTFEQLAPQVQDLVDRIREVTYNSMHDVISTVHLLLALDPGVIKMLNEYSPPDLRNLVETHNRLQNQAMEILSVSVRHLVKLQGAQAAGNGARDQTGEKRRAPPPWGKSGYEKRPRY